MDFISGEFLETIAAIHVAEKIGSQERAIDSKNNKINTLDEAVDSLKKDILERDKEIARLKVELKFAEDFVVEVQERERKYSKSIKKESDELEEYYRGLLCKPMNEIAGHNVSFKETYEAQQVIFASWIVSQKAFKEVAMRCGAKLGKSVEEIIKEGLWAKELVLLNKSEFSSGNNVLSSPLANEKKQELLDKLSVELRL